MKGIIVDDESTAREIMLEMCKAIPEVEIVALFPNAIEALKYVNHNPVDLIFLDIHMPGMTGIDFVQTLNDAPKIVLTTSDTNFAIEAYQYDFIVDYLVKPIPKDRFETTVKRLRRAFKEPEENGEEGTTGNQELYINIDRRLIKLKLDDILYIEAKGDYIHIKTVKEEFRVHSTLKKIKDKLPDRLFMQIHRSFVINFTKIIDIQDNSVLIDRQVIPISRSNRPVLMQRLNLL